MLPEMVTTFIKDDFVRVRTANKNYVLVWGDPVEVIGRDGRNTASGSPKTSRNGSGYGRHHGAVGLRGGIGAFVGHPLAFRPRNVKKARKT